MNRLWRVAGGLLLAHVILLLAGYSQMRVPVLGASSDDIVRTYAGVPATRMYLGGYVGILAWLALLAAVTLLARLLRGSTESSRWLAGLVATAGVAATAVTAVAFVTTGAAYYGATHRYTADVVAGITTVSKFADLVAMSVLGVCAVAVGAAGLAGRTLPRWIAVISLLVGVVGIASGANQGLLDVGNLLWLAYLVVFSVVLLRGPARRTPRSAPTSAAAATSAPAVSGDAERTVAVQAS
jgi:hypothetical protein